METVKAFLERWDLLGFVVAGLISAVIMLLIDGFRSLFNMKRKKYCISKSLISSTVYQQMEKEGLKISVSFNDHDIEGALTILKIRLRNDGAEDLMYSQRISYLHMVAAGLDLIDVSVVTDVDGVNPEITAIGDGKYDVKWDLLKSDEYFYIKVVVKGEVSDMSGVEFEVRADGINHIKTPEYKVSEAMLPVWSAVALIIIPVILFWPSREMFLDILPMKWLLVGSMIIFALAFWIGALKQRIRWMKEK